MPSLGREHAKCDTLETPSLVTAVNPRCLEPPPCRNLLMIIMVISNKAPLVVFPKSLLTGSRAECFNQSTHDSKT